MSELYELPNGWKWCSIKSIVVDTKSKNPNDLDAQTFTYIDIGSVNNETFQIEEPKTINVEDAPSRARKEVRLNDVIYSTTRPNLKNIAIVTNAYENPIASTGFCVLRVTDKSNNRYLFYYLLTKTYFEQIESKIRGAQYPAVSDSDVKNSQIPLPPLIEQQRIVEKLDLLFEKIDKAIALHQKNIDEADAFMGSALNEVFGELEEKYEGVELTKYVTFNGGSQPPKSQFSEVQLDGYVRLIQIRDYKSDNHIVYVNRKSVRKFCTKDDVMIGRYGPPVFQILRGIDGAYNVALMRADPNEKHLTKDYLFNFLQNPKLQNYIIGLSQRAAGQSGVNKEALEKYLIPIPPLPTQQKVVTYLDDLSDKIERVKTVQKEKMDSLKALKASILDKAFRGQL